MCIWQLFRKRPSHEDVHTIGEYKLSDRAIGKGLRADGMVRELNARNCFDFYYQPAEGDNLHIMQNTSRAPYLSFLYHNGKWLVDHYNAPETTLRKVSKGKIKRADPFKRPFKRSANHTKIWKP
ncbi:MAG: hypothetical protein GVX78_04985 [Bacteroidetes bacterium]|jgi:hypothetical protein|nr:hypothetical protein [Bacteroidota bacterium]